MFLGSVSSGHHPLSPSPPLPPHHNPSLPILIPLSPSPSLSPSLSLSHPYLLSPYPPIPIPLSPALAPLPPSLSQCILETLLLFPPRAFCFPAAPDSLRLFLSVCHHLRPSEDTAFVLLYDVDVACFPASTSCCGWAIQPDYPTGFLTSREFH